MTTWGASDEAAAGDAFVRPDVCVGFRLTVRLELTKGADAEENERLDATLYAPSTTQARQLYRPGIGFFTYPAQSMTGSVVPVITQSCGRTFKHVAPAAP